VAPRADAVPTEALLLRQAGLLAEGGTGSQNERRRFADLAAARGPAVEVVFQLDLSGVVEHHPERRSNRPAAAARPSAKGPSTPAGKSAISSTLVVFIIATGGDGIGQDQGQAGPGCSGRCI